MAGPILSQSSPKPVTIPKRDQFVERVVDDHHQRAADRQFPALAGAVGRRAGGQDPNEGVGDAGDAVSPELVASEPQPRRHSRLRSGRVARLQPAVRHRFAEDTGRFAVLVAVERAVRLSGVGRSIPASYSARVLATAMWWHDRQSRTGWLGATVIEIVPRRVPSFGERSPGRIPGRRSSGRRGNGPTRSRTRRGCRRWSDTAGAASSSWRHGRTRSPSVWAWASLRPGHCEPALQVDLVDRPRWQGRTSSSDPDSDDPAKLEQHCVHFGSSRIHRQDRSTVDQELRVGRSLSPESTSAAGVAEPPVGDLGSGCHPGVAAPDHFVQKPHELAGKCQAAR